MFAADSQNSLLLELLRRVDLLQYQIDQKSQREAYPESAAHHPSLFALSQRPSVRTSYSVGPLPKRHSVSMHEPRTEEPFEAYDGFFIHTGISYVPCYVSSSSGALLLRLATDSFVFSVPFLAITGIACDAIQLPDTSKLLYMSRISYLDEGQSLHSYNALTVYSPSKSLSEQLVNYLVREARLMSRDRIETHPAHMGLDNLGRGRSQSYSRPSFSGKRSYTNPAWKDVPFPYPDGREMSLGSIAPSNFASGINVQASSLKTPVESAQKFWPELVARRQSYMHDSYSAYSGKQYDTERDMGFYSFTTNASMYDRPISQSENLRMATGTQASNLLSFGQGCTGVAHLATHSSSPKRSSQMQSDTASVFQQSGYANPSSQTEPSKKLDGITEKSLNSICNEYERVIEQQNELVTNLWGIVGELNRRLREKGE